MSPLSAAIYNIDTSTKEIYEVLEKCDSVVKITDHISYGVWKSDFNAKDRWDLINIQSFMIDYFKSITEINYKVNETCKAYLQGNSRRLRLKKLEKKQCL